MSREGLLPELLRYVRFVDTALMAAAGVNWSVRQTYTESKEGLMEAVKLRLEKGADVNAVNTMGFTALTGQSTAHPTISSYIW